MNLITVEKCNTTFKRTKNRCVLGVCVLWGGSFAAQCIPFFLNGMMHNSLGCLRNEKENTPYIRETIEQYNILLVTC